MRRKFFEIQAATPAPVAAEALARIGALYAVEREIRGLSADSRRSVRHARAKSILEAMKPWLEAKLAAVSGKSTIAEAIRYALSRWAGLTRYLDDGRIEIDNNVVERAMRPIALGDNHLFAGSDEGGRHWAVHASLIETAKMNDLDPQAYLADVLAKIAGRHPMASTNCSPGPTSKRRPSGRWPENSAYEKAVAELNELGFRFSLVEGASTELRHVRLPLKHKQQERHARQPPKPQSVKREAACPALFAISKRARIMMGECIGRERPKSRSRSKNSWQRVCEGVSSWTADAHPLKAIGLVATIIAFGSAMLVKEAWTVL